jgi:adenosyl cobinamide kinase/adenosyl cobinamide phosphate guanylyltransferase
MEKNPRRPLFENDFDEKAMKQYVKTDLKLVHAIEITWGNGVVCRSISEQNKVGEFEGHHGKSWYGAGYYLIKDENKQYYVCRKDIFEDEYAEVGESHMLERIPMWHTARKSSKLPAILPNEASMTIVDVDFSELENSMVPPYLTARIVANQEIFEVIYEAYQTVKRRNNGTTELIFLRNNARSPGAKANPTDLEIPQSQKKPEDDQE